MVEHGSSRTDENVCVRSRGSVTTVGLVAEVKVPPGGE